MVAAISPQRALRRVQARSQLSMLTGGYTGARRDRRATQEWTVSGGSADADLLPDLETLRERSRDLERNIPLATGAIATNVSSIVGTGLKAFPMIDRDALGLTEDAANAWERQAEAIWSAWASGKDCDVSRTQRFAEQQALVVRSKMLNGDHFVVVRFRDRGRGLATALQHVEADRICNPNRARDGSKLPNGNQVAGGIELDADMAPVRCHVLKTHPGSLQVSLGEWTSLPVFAEDGRRLVLHLFDRKRPDQTRGVPYLAPVIETLKQLGRYTDAELAAAVLSAMFTVFVKTEGSASPLGQASAAGTDPRSAADFKLGEGAILDLGPGEDIVTANPGRPNALFDPFVMAMLRQVGVALELPFEVLIKHFTASYSASRAALLEAWKFWRGRRAWLAAEFCQPVYEEVIGEAVLRGMLAAPGFFDDPRLRHAWLGCEWIGDAQGQLDPLKEANAQKVQVEEGFTTRNRAAAELNGVSFEVNQRVRAREERMRRQDGTVPAAAPAQPAPPQPDSEDDQP